MPFPLTDYAARRPYLYHLTVRENLLYIQAERRLLSAEVLLRAAGREGVLRTKRTAMTALGIDARLAVLRDQSPLHQGNIALAPGWTFERVIEDLNRRVFFWPGNECGPIDYGRRHIAHYLPQDPAVLRVRFASLHDCNPGRIPLFCRYNSGSPRHSGGKPSPRGPETFLSADRFPDRPGSVVEVTFLDQVLLPDDTEVTLLSGGSAPSAHLVGPWAPLLPPP